MKPETGNVFANGQALTISFPCSLEEFLNQRGLQSKQVVVEYNGVVLAKEAAARTELREGDRLEIIVPVAGG